MKEKEGSQARARRTRVSWFILLAVVMFSVIMFISVPLYFSIPIFVLILLPIILYILIYKWIKKVFPSVVFTFSIWLNIVILIIPIFAGLAFLDFSDFSRSLREDPKYLAINTDDIIFATKVDSLFLSVQGAASSEEYEVLDKENITNLKRELNSKVDNKIVFVLDDEVFRDVEQITIQDIGITITRDQVFALLEADDPMGIIEDKFDVPPNLLSSMDLESERVKLVAVALLLEEAMEEGGPGIFIGELKKGNIKIYPRRFSIELLIRIMPEDILSQTGLIPELPAGSLDLAREVSNGKGG